MTSNIEQTNQFVTLTNAAQTIYAIDTGKTHLIPAQGAGRIFNLPLPQPGLNYKFIVIGATVGNNVTMTPTGGATVTGLCFNFTPGLGAAAAIATPNINQAASVIIRQPAPRGTYLNMNCDGKDWYIEGMSNGNGFQ